VYSGLRLECRLHPMKGVLRCLYVSSQTREAALRRQKKLRAESLSPLLSFDPDSTLSLQEQLRRSLVRALSVGAVSPGVRLPSSRKLAARLGVSRNTVMLAYQRLIADGHLEARERSGVYAPDAQAGPRAVDPLRSSSGFVEGVEPGVAPPFPPIDSARYRIPPDWQSYRHPFIEGRYDRSLFPIAEWREASRLALAAAEVEDWSLDNGEADDEMLIEEIRTKLLPRRGVAARRDEVLITVGEQQALFLASEILAGPGVVAGVENPGLPEMRELLMRRGAEIRGLAIDEAGLIVSEALRNCGLIYLSPSRQRPTGVTLPSSRRAALMAQVRETGAFVIEDDFECELNYFGDAPRALRSMPGGERVVYVASLAKVLAPGVRLGFMVADAPIIAAARRLRDLTTRRPSPNNQRAAAYFLALGHYESMVRRLAAIGEERLIALRDALNHYRPLSIDVAPVQGGTSYWVRGPADLQVEALLEAARARGVLIEPAWPYFLEPSEAGSVFRLGVTSLPAGRIRTGIAELSAAIRALKAVPLEAQPQPLSGDAVLSALSGARLLYNTVYGDPCVIDLHPDGRMSGRAGYANEDRDEGRWWMDGDVWRRQWSRWAYGEAAGFLVSLEGDRLSWLNSEGRRVDGAILTRPEP
jgi:GntR family transcriptional regulator/MocR family aminotransferase